LGTPISGKRQSTANPDTYLLAVIFFLSLTIFSIMINHTSVSKCNLRGVDASVINMLNFGSVKYHGYKKILVVVTTSNLWPITEIMLHSLVQTYTSVNLKVIDDYSYDGTYEKLTSCGIDTVRPSYPNLGVSNLWNLAFKIFLEAPSHEILILSNNDVLIPRQSIGLIEQTFGM
jgi:hypothetical protein